MGVDAGGVHSPGRIAAADEMKRLPPTAGDAKGKAYEEEG